MLKQLSQDPASVNALKNMCDPYIHKILIKIINSEDPEEHSDLGLHCLSGPFVK